ncbi:MAG: Ig-like domain-containing protein, partial [Bacteroidales bacterium]|nr:Ig-like domain-containing protein [Bacteroidales bacterium]
WTNQAADTAEGTKVVVKVDDPSEEASEEPSDEPAGDEVFAKVTSISAGDYLIVWEGENPVAFDGSIVESIDAPSNTIPVIITDGKIEATSATKASVFTFAAIDGGYSVKSASGQFIGGKSGANTIVVGAEAILNTVAFEEGNAIITSNTSFIQYNKNSGQERFRYYKSGTSTQQPVALYKLVGASTETSEDPSQEPVEESDIVASVTESLVIDLGGEDAQIEVEVSDPAEGAAVAYASADEQVVTVTKDGVVHAVAAGETTVTVTITAEGYKPLEKVVNVTVSEPTVNPSDDPIVEEIKVVTVAEFLAEDPFTDYTKAQKYQLTGTITSIANTTYGNINLEDETGSIYVYGLTATEQGLKSNTAANNDKSFASLNLKAGDTVTIVGYRYVYASSNTDQVLGAYYVSHVAGDAITELTFKASATVEVGKTVDIAATNNVNAPVVYVSGDESIVTVSEAGVITGISTGSTTVTAKVVAVPGQYTGAEKVCNVTVAPASSGGKAAVGTTLWAETWEGGSASATPAAYSQSGTTVYGTGNVTYTFDGGQSTKLYIDNNMDGSTIQENLLLAKKSGTWTISGIPTGGATKVLLKYYVNNNSGISTKCAVSSSTATVGDQTAGEETAKPFSFTHEITVTGLTTFDLTFSNTNDGNVRLDDLSIVVVE